jgi:hypothetical protein
MKLAVYFGLLCLITFFACVNRSGCVTCVCVLVSNCYAIGKVSQSMLLVTIAIAVNAKYICVYILICY